MQGSLADELQAERDADLDIDSLASVEMSEPSELGPLREKAEGATALLGAQRSKLVEELRARRQLILLLSSSVERQNEQCQKLLDAMGACDGLLETATSAIEQIGAREAQMAAIAREAAEAL
jgi:hypothetical protein